LSSPSVARNASARSRDWLRAISINCGAVSLLAACEGKAASAAPRAIEVRMDMVQYYMGLAIL